MWCVCFGKFICFIGGELGVMLFLNVVFEYGGVIVVLFCVVVWKEEFLWDLMDLWCKFICVVILGVVYYWDESGY